MAMNIELAVEATTLKIQESVSALNALMESDVSENTKRTQKYQRTRDIRTLHIIKSLLEKMDKNMDMRDVLDGPDTLPWFESLVTLASERKAKYVVEVREGDKVIELMEKYRDVKDIYKKMMKAAEDAGLRADFNKGIFVRA